ncbi:MAG: SO_0444 family Cu/Zn efflux transporter [Planctomycetes bacterium]|nr:SO_0444 family Cu/Zn efflux transporter [Planctomycetota bacterium]
MDPILPTTALLLVAASALGAVLPLYRRWSERGLHLFVALAAGIFLGTIFFHLLPHLAGVEHEHAHSGLAEEVAHSVWPWGAALAGILLLFLLEKVWLPARTREAGSNPHALLWTATYLGLALHAATAGIALAGILSIPEGRAQFLVSILVHKATECFSLATVMRLAGLPLGRSVLLLGLFALIEPAGLLAGGEIAAALPAAGPILTGFAAGTFLYVAVGDLLPEVFHGAGSVRLKVGAVLLGVAVPTLTLERVELAAGFARAALLESWSVFLAMAPYLLAGFALAGIVRMVLKPERVVPRLGGNDLKSVGWASLLGAPLPLCSCSVIPVALSLRKAGASKGATSAFTVSTPETGIDSIAVTWALLDPLITIARPIGAVLSAIATGGAVNWLVRRGFDEPRRGPLADAALPGAGEQAARASASCCAHEGSSPAGRAPETATPAGGAVDAAAVHADEEHAGHAHTGPTATRPEQPFLRRALRFGFVDMLDDLAPSLVLGLLLSGAIVAALPASALENPAVHGIGGYLLMLAVGVPIYVCAAASTPIAAALILKGLSPGAAFVYLLVGPATNIASLVVLSRAIGPRIVAVQVAALAVCAVLLGIAVDALYGALAIAPSASLAPAHEHGAPWLAWGSAALLATLLLISLVRTHGSRDLLATLREGPNPA